MIPAAIIPRTTDTCPMCGGQEVWQVFTPAELGGTDFIDGCGICLVHWRRSQRVPVLHPDTVQPRRSQVTETAMTLEAIVADITEAAKDAATPPELGRRLEHFAKVNDEELKDLRVTLLACAMGTIQAAEEQGIDSEIIHRIVAQEMECAAAIVVRALYKRLDRPFSPGRFALVAHLNATHADKLFSPEIDTLAAAMIEKIRDTVPPHLQQSFNGEEALRA